MSRNQLRYVFGALTITAMALMLVLAFGHNATRVTESAPSSDVAALQAENAQLNQTLQVMQQREQQYQSEIQQANDTITQLLNGSTISQNAQGSDPSFFNNAQSALQNLFGDNGSSFSDDAAGYQDNDAFQQQFSRPYGHSHEGRRP